MGLALVLAIVLNNIIRGRLSTFFRTVFFLPVMAAASVIGVVLTFVLSPSNGPVSFFLTSTGLSDAPVEFSRIRPWPCGARSRRNVEELA